MSASGLGVFRFLGTQNLNSIHQPERSGHNLALTKESKDIKQTCANLILATHKRNFVWLIKRHPCLALSLLSPAALFREGLLGGVLLPVSAMAGIANFPLEEELSFLSFPKLAETQHRCMVRKKGS